MGVNKTTGFAAPYRSATFRAMVESLENKNGVLIYNGELSESGGDLTIPPLAFLQNGLIVVKDTNKIITVPSLTEPFYVVATSPSASNIDDVIYSFAKAPYDITDDSVILGEKANGSWRKAQVLTISGILETISNEKIALGFTKPLSGLRTTYGGGVFTTSSGSIIDKSGHMIAVEQPVTKAPFIDDVDFARVDRVIFQRPLVSPDRIGEVLHVRGGTYSDVSNLKTPVDIEDALVPHTNVKSVILSDNTIVYLVTTGYGNNFDISYSRYGTDRTTQLVAPTVIKSGITTDNIDVSITNTDILQVVYEVDDQIKASRFTGSTGVIVGTEISITTNVLDVHTQPTITRFPAGDVLISYLKLVTPGNYSLFFTTFTDSFAPIFSAQNVSGAGNFANASIAIDRNKSVHLAYENILAGTILYSQLDDGFAVVTPASIISAATEHPTHGTLINAATTPKVIVSQNEEVFVLFKQEKPSTDYGISVWANGSATMIDLSGASEDIVAFDATLSESNGSLNITLSISAGETHYVKRLSSETYISEQLAAYGARKVNQILDLSGSLLHAFAQEFPGTYTGYAGPFDVQYAGSQGIVGSLNTIALGSNQILVLFSERPAQGDRVTISGSINGNDGVFLAQLIEVVSLNAVDDYAVVTIDSALSGSAENDPVNTKTNYASPDGMDVTTVKSVSDIASWAFSTRERITDVLLARILQPGNTVLNYFTGASALLNSDNLGLFGDATYAWETISPSELIITNDLKIVDFVANLVYTIPANTLTINDDYALYVRLEDTDLAPNYLTAPLNALPFGDPIQVLGFAKNGVFYPHLLAKADIGALESGETVVVGNDLSTASRARLGLVGDTSFTAYSSTNIIGANDSYPTAISKLDAEVSANNLKSNEDRTLKLINGGSWSWVGGTLKWSADAHVQIAQFADDRNTIQANSVALAAGEIAYVALNRVSDLLTNLTVSVGTMAALTGDDTTFIIARRVGANVYLSNGILLKPGEIIELDAVLAEVNRYLRRLELRPLASNPKRLEITVPETAMLDGSKVGQVIASLMMNPLFSAQIDPVTGTIYEGDGITALGQDFTPPTIAAGKYRWFGVSLIPSGVNALGEMNAQVLVQVGTSDGNTPALATKEGAILGGETPIGWFYVQRNALDTDIEDIAYDNIVRAPASGGGSGGSGDANADLTRYNDRLNLSPFALAATNIAATDKDTLLDISSTATFDLTSKSFKFLDSTAQVLLSLQSLDDNFLNPTDEDNNPVDPTDLNTVEVYAIWNVFDSLATYELTRDGVNWQTAAGKRVGNSDTFRALHTFANEPSNAFNQEYAVANADALKDFNGTSAQNISQKFTVAQTTVFKNVLTYINKNQVTSTGRFFVEIVKDNAGTPSEDPNDSVWVSAGQNIDNLAVGNNVVNIVSQFVVLAGDYHIVIRPDEAYRVAYNNDSNDKISLRMDSSAGPTPNLRTYGGSVWSAEVANETAVYRLEGRVLDLRIRITSSGSVNDKLLSSYGLFYKYEDGVEFTKPVFLERFRFDGTVDNLNEFTITNFLPDSRLLMCFALGTGQVFRYGDFVLDGQKVIFPPNTFNVVGNVELEFLQLQGVDGLASTVADSLLAASFLGSKDDSIDKSQNGRGPTLKNANGDYIEIGLDEFNQWTFTVK